MAVVYLYWLGLLVVVVVVGCDGDCVVGLGGQCCWWLLLVLSLVVSSFWGRLVWVASAEVV